MTTFRTIMSPAEAAQNCMNAIADPNADVMDIAGYYAEMIVRSGGMDFYPRVNRAIIERWSPSALKRIKRAAWKMAEAGDVLP